MNHSSQNFGNPLPAQRQTEIHISESTKETIGIVLERLREIYLEGKELETEQLKIKAYQAEIIESYKTQRENLMLSFQAQKESRAVLETMLKDAIAQNDHELKLQLLAVYKDYLKSLVELSKIQPFRSYGYKSDAHANETIIEI